MKFTEVISWAIVAVSFIACSKVTVRQTGNHTYFLKCYYSRSKCDDAIRKVCRDEDKVSTILSQREKMESSFAILPLGFLSSKRPVNYITVECTEWKPKAKDSTRTPNLNNWVQPNE
ncbi:MAG TPA: hypothetical protein VJ385_21330 [Fibrobacteria bacterium]|nr:hypothetical protein [Fibrobacteria bacterium]